MEYVSVTARFLFFNGVKRYTVEWAYGLSKWFVFNEEEKTKAVYVSKEDRRIKMSDINKLSAESILSDYLNAHL